MKYDILEEENIGHLIAKVNLKISDGWRPIGGVNTQVIVSTYAVGISSHCYYQQAVILTDKAEKRIEAEKPE